MSQQPLEITVYTNPNRIIGPSGASGNAQTQQRIAQESWNPFNMFQLSFPQFNMGANALWLMLGLMALIVTLAMVKRSK